MCVFCVCGTLWSVSVFSCLFHASAVTCSFHSLVTNSACAYPVLGSIVSYSRAPDSSKTSSFSPPLYKNTNMTTSLTTSDAHTPLSTHSRACVWLLLRAMRQTPLLVSACHLPTQKMHTPTPARVARPRRNAMPTLYQPTHNVNILLQPCLRGVLCVCHYCRCMCVALNTPRSQPTTTDQAVAINGRHCAVLHCYLAVHLPGLLLLPST